MSEGHFTELERKIRELGSQTIDRDEVDRKLSELRRQAEELNAQDIQIGLTCWYQWPIVLVKKLLRKTV